MFICGYHFPASEGNDVGFDKVVEKIDTNLEGAEAGKTVTLTSETKEGKILEELTVPAGTFAHKAFVDYYKNSDIETDFKMIYYTNKYQISEISKSIDGAATAELCKKLDDMNLYRVKVA